MAFWAYRILRILNPYWIHHDLLHPSRGDQALLADLYKRSGSALKIVRPARALQQVASIVLDTRLAISPHADADYFVRKDENAGISLQASACNLLVILAAS
jgi:hypothetical protein